MRILPAAVLLAAGIARLASSAEPKLAVVHSAMAQVEDGPPLAPNERFLPGELIYFSCQVEGYQRRPKEYDQSTVYLSYRIAVQDVKGVLLQPPQEGKFETTVSAEDKNWMPKIRETINVPPFADSGEYRVVIALKDEQAGTTAEGKASFFVKGRDVEPSDTLVVRNFRFLRSEDDDKALATAAYRQGDAVWARFDMTGYKLADGNQFDLDYGLTVLREDGSVAYAEPHAAGAKDHSFYPQRYQPGVLNLALAKDQKLGRYTIVLSVHDNLGMQNYETRATFSVE